MKPTKPMMGLLLATLLWMAGCNITETLRGGEGTLAVTIESSGRTVSASEPVELTVTAYNQGERRVIWGRGSSTCQLDFSVEIGGTLYPGASRRACTDDLSEQALGPGERRRESFEWDGSVLRGGEIRPLPRGSYKVYGTAGPYRSAPLTLVVVEP